MPDAPSPPITPPAYFPSPRPSNPHQTASERKAFTRANASKASILADIALYMSQGLRADFERSKDKRLRTRQAMAVSTLLRAWADMRETRRALRLGLKGHWRRKSRATAPTSHTTGERGPLGRSAPLPVEAPLEVLPAGDPTAISAQNEGAGQANSAKAA